MGRLIYTDSKDNLDYTAPNIRVNNLTNLTYLDTPEVSDYEGDLKLIPTSKKTNRWVERLEKNKIKDFKIVGPKVIEVEKDMDVKWNVPIPVKDNVESISLDDPKYTFMVESTLQVKGTTNQFTILNTYKPDFKSDTVKDIKVDVESLINPTNITYTSSRPLEERTIGFDNNTTIIRDRIVVIESALYDKNTPVVDKERVQYCKCGPASYVSVPSESTIGCEQWCCVNSYKETAYYPCREKTIKQWADGMNLTRKVSPTINNGIIRGL